jgi:nicotinate-nucleotide adenylyltransferase
VRTGILGGTFDPVHLGHLVLGEWARTQLLLDRVLFIPAGQPWRKEDRDVSPASDRVAMLELAIQDNLAFELSRVEVDRPGPSYLYETLEGLHKEDPAAELFFILGRDALADLPNWRSPERIVELATLAVASRAGAGEGPTAVEGIEARLVILEMPEIGVSSTMVRSLVEAGRSVRYLVPDSVREYIESANLYRDC